MAVFALDRRKTYIASDRHRAFARAAIALGIICVGAFLGATAKGAEIANARTGNTPCVLPVAA